MDKPKYKQGDVVLAKYGSPFWPDVMFKVEEISPNHGGVGNHRYWGTDSKGVAHGAYESQLSKPTIQSAANP